jgi:HAD superfamily hydrolase (TIGR01509 family)
LTDSVGAPFAPQAIVFDMDGLLLDTERIAMAMFEQACGLHGVKFDRALYERCIGTSMQGTREILERALGVDVYGRLDREWSRLYSARVGTQAVDVKDGALELLEVVRLAGLPTALATSTATALARTKLGLAGLDRYFATIVGGDVVTRGKPHPEPYLTAARSLGVEPERCWAIEDSDNGVRAAHAAGFFVFQVPDLVQPAADVRGLGHAVVGSLRDVAHALTAHGYGV